MSNYFFNSTYDDLIIDGPFGLGLRLVSYEKGTILIFAGGTGFL